MDIACPRCGEPFDFDEFHEYVGEEIPGGKMLERFTSFQQVKNFFFSKGCGVLMTGNPCRGAANETDKTRAAFSSALHDLMGDDVDGIASELEDAEYLGLI